MTIDLHVTMSDGTHRRVPHPNASMAQKSRDLILQAASSGGSGSSTTLHDGQESITFIARHVAIIEVREHEDD